MKKTLAFLAAALLVASLSAQPNQYFFKKLSADAASTACFDPDSNLWIGATRGPQPLLLKLSREGILLDQVQLNLPYGNGNWCSELLFDSDGMLVGCGTLSPAVGGTHEASFAFRYDPVARELLWHRILQRTFFFASGILEKAPGGPFLVYGSNFDLRSTADALLLDRETGEADPGFNFNYRVGLEEYWYGAVLHQGELYATGKNDLGSFVINEYMRQGIWRIAADGAPVWALLCTVPDNQRANLIGLDLLVENDTIVSLSRGNETTVLLPGAQNTNLFLQKTTLDGALVWAKKLDVSDFGYESETGFDLIAVADGYVIYGGSRGGFERDFLIKTDKNGKVLWAQGLRAIGFAEGYSKTQSRLLSDGRALYVVTQFRENNKQYAALVKTDLNGNISGCDRLFPLFAREIPLANPFFSKKNFLRSASTLVSDETPAEILPAAAQNLEQYCSAADVAPDPCRPGTFLQRLDSAVQLRCLAASPSGALYAAGQGAGDGLLAGFDTSGALIWTYRLAGEPGDQLRITSLLVDADQWLAGCGLLTDPAGQSSPFAFRFRPDSAQLLWANQAPGLAGGPGGLVEMSPGGNFLLYRNLRLPDGRQVPETVQFDRATGAVVPLSGRRYDFDSGNQVFGSLLALGPFLYAVGQNERLGRPQLALTRLNSNFGGLNWARLNLPDTAAQAFSGGGGSLCLDNNQPVYAYTGGSGGVSRRLFLQKTSGLGDIIWLRYWEILNVSELDVLALPTGGFIVLAKSGPAFYTLLRTDLNGNLLVAKTLQL
ncbi:MAG: hypothetical protein JNK89_06875, partial [Saprospiraceae bacterium]|nr:hypothetical protein [Saprospiraceae bacterium]